MRNLIILRGPELSGRKSYIKANGLAPWLVDQAMLETVFSEPVSDPNGGKRMDPQQRQRIRRRILSILEEKMCRGALIAFRPTDTGVPYSRTAASAADKMIASVIELARKHRYTTRIVDFTNACSTDELHKRRLKMSREARPDEIDRVIRHMKRKIGIPTGADIFWQSNAEAKDILEQIEPEVIDLSDWRNIVVIGDIHGCSATLAQLTDNFEVRSDTAYIMLGDYINKGPDSGGVIRALLDKFAPHPNCFFLTGNHERSLSDWARGVDTTKKAFYSTGLPSLQASGITQQDARAFLDHTVDAARFHWRGLDILATHGGFAQPPEALALFAAEHFQLGTDSAHFDVDAAWERNVLEGRIPGPKKLIQIHGHRNPNGRPIAAGIGTFCLEESVDQGGPLRALTLSPQGEGYAFREIYIANKDMTLKAAPEEKYPEIGKVSI